MKDVLKQITEMHETLQPGQVHDLYHEAYMALLTFQIEDLTEKISAITAAGSTQLILQSAQRSYAALHSAHSMKQETAQIEVDAELLTIDTIHARLPLCIPFSVAVLMRHRRWQICC